MDSVSHNNTHSMRLDRRWGREAKKPIDPNLTLFLFGDTVHRIGALPNITRKIDMQEKMPTFDLHNLLVQPVPPAQAECGGGKNAYTGETGLAFRRLLVLGPGAGAVG